MAAAAFWRAWSIWTVSVAATVAALGYNALHPLPAKLASQAGSASTGVVAVVLIAAFATVGALLAWKRPENPIGWLLSATGLTYAVGAVSELLLQFPRTLTLANWLGWIWLLGIGLCVFVVLLFPSGHLPSRRWRPVAWAAAAGLAAWVVGNAFAPTIITASPPSPNPIGAAGPTGDIFKLMALGGAGLLAGTGVAGMLSLVIRYRQAQTVERTQLKWLVYAGTLVVAALLAMAPIEWIMGPGSAATNLQNGLTSGTVALLAVAIGIAVLRYRLYDIDRVISRTVGYSIITGLLAGLYAGLVLLATRVPDLTSQVGVAFATLAAAALFNPLRRRVQHRVDKRFNRARYNADNTVAAFAARLQDATDPDAIRSDLMSTIHRAVEPAHVSLWVSQRD
jgi:hypothetical protein